VELGNSNERGRRCNTTIHRDQRDTQRQHISGTQRQPDILNIIRHISNRLGARFFECSDSSDASDDKTDPYPEHESDQDSNDDHQPAHKHRGNSTKDQDDNGAQPTITIGRGPEDQQFADTTEQGADIAPAEEMGMTGVGLQTEWVVRTPEQKMTTEHSS
jgi:hypothetical protein